MIEENKSIPNYLIEKAIQCNMKNVDKNDKQILREILNC